MSTDQLEGLYSSGSLNSDGIDLLLEELGRRTTHAAQALRQIVEQQNSIERNKQAVTLKSDISEASSNIKVSGSNPRENSKLNVGHGREKAAKGNVLGIDFGTSNCVAFAPSYSGDAYAVPLEGDQILLPSVVFTTRKEIALKQIDANEYSARLKKARSEEKRREREGLQPISDELLKKSIEDALKREATEQADKAYWDQTFISMLSGGQAMLYGSPALRAYMLDPLSGTLVKSPKTFLGSRLGSEYVSVFEDVVASMLTHIKNKAESDQNCSFSRVVLGRPVNYHGTDPQFANRQAVQIMTAAARKAGFQEVDFYLEPLAAALTFERGLSSEKRVLVIDIGGGTTDCTVVRVGPDLTQKVNRTADILSCTGDRIGGTDFDQAFTWANFMPLFGKGSLSRSGLPLPHNVLVDAISTRDVHAQVRFNGSAYLINELLVQARSPELIRRLQVVHKNQYQHRLINSAEQTKIVLSDQPNCTTPLAYIEMGLAKRSTLSDFEQSNYSTLDRIEGVVKQALRDAGTKPDVCFITGGMGASPVVRKRLATLLGSELPIVYGDMMGSVGKGLGLRAGMMV